MLRARVIPILLRFALLALPTLPALLGCGRNTDIMRRDEDVDAWVAEERAKEAERERTREQPPKAAPGQPEGAKPDK
jgi:hypothetical protein